MLMHEKACVIPIVKLPLSVYTLIIAVYFVLKLRHSVVSLNKTLDLLCTDSTQEMS